MTPEAILTLIRLHLKRCPGCGYDLSDAHNTTCPECGRDLAPDAVVVGGTRKVRPDDRWLKTFALSVVPSICIFFWLVLRTESLRRFVPDAKQPVGFFVFTVVLAILSALVSMQISKEDNESGSASTVLIGIAWALTLLMTLPHLAST